MKTLKNQKGFTLVELIVVIAIIGILSAVLIPSLTGYIDKAKKSTALQEAEALETVYESYLIEKEAGSTSQTFDDYAEATLGIAEDDLTVTVDGEGVVTGGEFVASNNYKVPFTIDSNGKLVFGEPTK